MNPLDKKQSGLAIVQITWLLAGILVMAAAGWDMAGHMRNPDVQFSTPFQAVLLSNGSVYFGHLDGYGGPHPVLTEVYYIATQTNADTKQTTNVLVKRGKELHEPDRMYLSPNQIIFVEPVGPGSKVARLISEAAP
jgi:hypothetical protein